MSHNPHLYGVKKYKVIPKRRKTVDQNNTLAEIQSLVNFALENGYEAKPVASKQPFAELMNDVRAHRYWYKKFMNRIDELERDIVKINYLKSQ